MDVITFPCWDKNWPLPVNGANGRFTHIPPNSFPDITCTEARLEIITRYMTLIHKSRWYKHKAKQNICILRCIGVQYSYLGAQWKIHGKEADIFF